MDDNKTPQEARTELLKQIFTDVEDPFSAVTSKLWPGFMTLMSNSALRVPLDQKWSHGYAAITEPKGEPGKKAKANPNPDDLRRLTAVLDCPECTRLKFIEAMNAWPGDASAELQKIEAEQEAEMDDDEEEEED